MGNKNRGSNTHGHGSSKKQRGAGSRGGRGKAGLGKKAKHKKIQAKKSGGYLGEKGFNRPQKVSRETTGINLRDIDQTIDTLVEEGFAEETDNGYVFYADKAGYDKVLGGGTLTQDIDVHAPSFSEGAERKITENGNEAVRTSSDEDDESA